MIVLIGRCNSDEESCDDELTYDELATSYRELCLRSAEVVQLGEKQKKMITQLKAEKEEHQETISKLKDEVIMLNSKLDKMTKTVRMLNKGTYTLEDILKIGKAAEDMSGLGFNKGKEPVSDFVHPISKPKSQMLNRKYQHHGRRQVNHSGGKFKHWKCHHCGRFGHIKPFCFKLYGYPKSAPQHRTQQVMSTVKKDNMLGSVLRCRIRITIQLETEDLFLKH